MANSDVREGFLCPVCMKDLGSIADLQEHFEEEHPQEDKAVIQQLKGLIGKAKRKILGKEREDGSVGDFNGMSDAPVYTKPVLSATGYDPTMWEKQDPGATRSHSAYFKNIRDARIDRYVVETNKMLIRLDKLISDEAPTDPAKRKHYEKQVVPWAPDRDVNLCITCGKSFTITRRRHHCRLCGGIICNKCSQFLPFSYGKKLTDPGFQYEGEGFRRSSSNSSLNSIMSPEGDPQVRTCVECRSLLERRDMQMEHRNAKPIIVQLYDRMKMYKDELEQILPTYEKMWQSLHAGETSYNLGEATVLKTKIAKLAENIDSISKRIAVLGLDNPDPPPARSLQLQRSIRTHITNFIQFNVMGLQNLPTQDELEKLQEARRIEIQRKIEAERRLMAEKEARRKQEQEREKETEDRKVTSSGLPKKNVKDQNLALGGGWKPSEANSFQSDTDDPMIQQMNIIKGYIKQARLAQKFDEVKMLEDNLKELQIEYYHQQNPQNLTR